ncbi:MAG TPA: ABC transporter permease [Terriglobales bacterium]|nr:ABC transporter permease [Terriglobales bacterium]
MSSFFADLRYGVHLLRKAPGFTAVAVVTLALGIGATTAVYSVVYAVVLNPFPYKDVDTLMSVRVSEPGQNGGRLSYTPPQFLEIAERNTIFSSAIASTISDVLWTSKDEPQRLRGNYVTRDTFSTMGVPPLLGRALTPDDFRPDSPPACVLGYRFWQSQFGGDPRVLGAELNLNGAVRTVVGVMPRPFMWRGADVYLPIVLQRDKVVDGVTDVHLLGRLKPGITEAQAEADLQPIIADLRRQDPKQFPENFRVSLLSFKETFPSGIRKGLLILLGAVALLLLIACANVSNLLLAKATSRQKEMAVRIALGAKRSRLIQQLLTESLLLAILGGALGGLLAYGGLKAIIAIVPAGTIPDEAVIAMSVPVLAFASAISVFTALLFGLVPALQAWTTNLASALKDRDTAAASNPRQRWIRNALVVGEVALSLMLLMGATLMVRTLLAVEAADLGIRRDHLLTFRVPLNEQRYSDLTRRNQFFQQLLEHVQSAHGVEAVALNTSMHPFGNWRRPVEVEGSSQADRRRVMLHQISAAYTTTAGIPLLRGRLFTVEEVYTQQAFALVNQAFVRRYFSNRDPVGRVVRIPDFKSPPLSASQDSFQVVGVVRDTLDWGWGGGGENTPELYIPFTFTGRASRVMVLSQGEPSSVVAEIRKQIASLDPNQPVTGMSTMEAELSENLMSEPRFNLALFATFAGLGLLLAVIGVYGLMSHLVSTRTHEIGVRIALGAEFRHVAGTILGDGAKLLIAGVCIGLLGSVATVRLIREQVWRVSPFDPLSFSLVVLILVTAGLMACFWPAFRAARLNPMVALRHE